MMRAMRKRYFARSLPDIEPQTPSKALRAAATARSMSRGPASETSASTSSLAGLMVLNVSPSSGSTNSPPMNSPYELAMLTIARDSGAGEYGNSLLVMCAPSVDRDVVGAGVVAGCHLLALQEEIVEQA